MENVSLFFFGGVGVNLKKRPTQTAGLWTVATLTMLWGDLAVCSEAGGEGTHLALLH